MIFLAEVVQHDVSSQVVYLVDQVCDMAWQITMFVCATAFVCTVISTSARWRQGNRTRKDAD